MNIIQYVKGYKTLKVECTICHSVVPIKETVYVNINTPIKNPTMFICDECLDNVARVLALQKEYEQYEKIYDKASRN